MALVLTDESSALQTLIAEIRELKALVQRLGQGSGERGRLYTLKEISDLTGLHENSIKRGMYDGRYKGYRHGSALRFDLDQVREAMRQEGGA